MKFIHTYTYQPSYLTHVLILAFMSLMLVDSFINYWFIIPLMLCCALAYYQLVYLRNKLMIGVNKEGVCIWTGRNSYLFCPFEAIATIQIKHYKIKHIKYDYLYIDYAYGRVLKVNNVSSYSKPNQDLTLDVVSKQSVSANFLNFNLHFRDVQRLERIIADNKNQYKQIAQNRSLDSFLS